MSIETVPLTVDDLVTGVGTGDMTIGDRRQRLLDLLARDESARNRMAQLVREKNQNEQRRSAALLALYINAWDDAANEGWYPNAFTPFSSSIDVIGGSDSSLDAFMLEHLKRDRDKLLHHLAARHNHRSAILVEAFQLLREQRFVAAIPILLSQSDGICHDGLGAYLFTDANERKQSLPKVFATKDSFAKRNSYFLERVRSYSDRMDAAQSCNNLCTLNRHGVMHGAKWHLDCGTELNAYKSLSLLAFVSFLLFD